MTVQSETVSLKAGKIRYHYDDAILQASKEESGGVGCEAALILGVGTATSVVDYDLVAKCIVNSNNKTVVIVADHSPRFWFNKQDSGRFANLSNEIVNDWFTQIFGRLPELFIVGGHSSGGLAALGALGTKNGAPSRYSFKPSGYFGLDPYQISAGGSIQVSIPSMSWGFRMNTCLVSVDRAAKAAYKASDKQHRVLYTIQNDKRYFQRPPGHCVFTDKGCGRLFFGINVCPTNEESSWIRQSVGESFQCFVSAIADGQFEKSRFELNKEAIVLQANNDEPEMSNKAAKKDSKSSGELSVVAT